MVDQNSLRLVIDKFWETVPPTWHSTRTIIRRVAYERFGLTVEQFQVLRRIRRGITSVSALAESSQTTRSAVSRAVDNLVNKGLIYRNSNPADRRIIPLALTVEGQEIMTAVYKEAEQWLVSKLSQLTEQETRDLLKTFDILHKVFLEGR